MHLIVWLASTVGGGVCWTTTKQPPWGGAREETEERSSSRSIDQSVWLIGHFKRKINDQNKDINLDSLSFGSKALFLLTTIYVS